MKKKTDYRNAFFDEFYEREKEWRKKGGKFLVPLPEFRVVS